MNMSVTNKMPINCGMEGMHGNGVKKSTEQDLSKVNTVASNQSMPENCGMKGMHQNNSTKTSQVTAKSDLNPNLGRKFDAKV